MQEPTEESVLGDFDGATFTHFGTTSTFSRTDGDFVVRTDGPDGELADFPITYAFGAEPLQQYLIELQGGRLQALSIAWDARSEAEGGQRWFHLYPEEEIAAGDPLHWTAPTMNWNYMCAECHSTDLRKNYEAASRSYETTWSDIDVSCEACHGPGSRHVELVSDQDGGALPRGVGLSGAMADPGGGWVIEAGETIAGRTVPLTSDAQIETCAHCHSRRATIDAERMAGMPLHDSDVVSRLEPGLYHPDGQILDEVYVYGSFVQSKMYSAGVRCSDCHDPHTLEPRAEGNALCSGCHLPATYDTAEHHNHQAGSTGAQCVECHMPATTYMVVDPRRDHSMRVPRPDLSERLGVPNACNSCHTTESPAWASEVVEGWYGPQDESDRHFAEVLQAGREGLPGAGQLLLDLARETEQSGIVRATAVSMTAAFPSQATLETLNVLADASDPMVRLGALSALEAFPPAARIGVAFRLLRDSTRAVRTEAARVLAPVQPTSLSAPQQALFTQVSTEYIEAQMANQDHPSAHLNVGNLFAQQGRADAAESAYREAVTLDSAFVPAYLNLADLYRALGRDAEGETTLARALEYAPDDPNVHHAMGLLLVRLGRPDDAISWLTEAVELAPEQPRFAYVLGVGLNSVGEGDSALSVLALALERSPYDRDLLTVLATLNRDRGQIASALRYAERLQEVAPEDPTVLQLLQTLGRPGP